MSRRRGRVRRALAIMGAASLLGCPAPAAAQDAGGDPQPLVGGGSFNSAPLVEAGTYEDTLLAGETLFYAVALAEGQRLEFEAVVDISGSERLSGGIPRAASGLVIVDVYSPLRQAFADTRELGSSDLEDEVVTATTKSPTVVSAEQAQSEDRDFDPYQGPGTYYVGINLSEGVFDLGALVELPMTLRFEVTGAPGSADLPRGPLEFSGAPGPDQRSPRERDPGRARRRRTARGRAGQRRAGRRAGCRRRWGPAGRRPARRGRRRAASSRQHPTRGLRRSVSIDAPY